MPLGGRKLAHLPPRAWPHPCCASSCPVLGWALALMASQACPPQNSAAHSGQGLKTPFSLSTHILDPVWAPPSQPQALWGGLGGLPLEKPLDFRGLAPSHCGARAHHTKRGDCAPRRAPASCSLPPAPSMLHGPVLGARRVVCLSP